MAELVEDTAAPLIVIESAVELVKAIGLVRQFKTP